MFEDENKPNNQGEQNNNENTQVNERNHEQNNYDYAQNNQYERNENDNNQNYGVNNGNNNYNNGYNNPNGNYNRGYNYNQNGNYQPNYYQNPNDNNGYNNYNNGYNNFNNANDLYNYGEGKKHSSKTTSILSMIFGIASIVLCCAWYIALPLAIVSLILGIIAQVKNANGFALAGIITASFGLAFGIAICVIAVSSQGFFEEFLNMYNSLYSEFGNGDLPVPEEQLPGGNAMINAVKHLISFIK